MTIGIPRALFYWKKPIFWETFFENLGLKVLLSPPTNKEIVERGVKIADPEACFATKVFLGHILWLGEKKLDYIFVPRLRRNKLGLEYCPRFFGLPDVSTLLVKVPIFSPWVDEKKENFRDTLFKIGKKFYFHTQKIEKAISKTSETIKKEKEKISKNYQQKIKSPKKKIVIVSHPYNLYDNYVNLGIKEKLKKLGVEPIFIDEIPTSPNNGRSSVIRGIDFHWEFGEEIVSQIEEILNYNIAGAIEISSFQCGCDAVLKEFVEKEFKIKKIPFLYLMIDEQTGEAGLQTRLEAFVDTINE